MKIKNLFTGAIAALAMTASAALADITLVVPQKAGQGTTVWAEIIVKELEKHLGERIVLRLILAHVTFQVSTSFTMTYVLTKTQSL